MKTLLKNARLATMRPDLPGLGRIEDASLMIEDGRITHAGPAADLAADQVIDCENRWVTPALIDCHTHLVYGGNRAREFEMRLAGATYENIRKTKQLSFHWGNHLPVPNPIGTGWLCNG